VLWSVGAGTDGWGGGDRHWGVGGEVVGGSRGGGGGVGLWRFVCGAVMTGGGVLVG
jgi:hypothetical protein